MYNLKTLVFCFLLTLSVASAFLEDSAFYLIHPKCKPSTLNEGIPCERFGSSVPVGGGLYNNWELHYNPLSSYYYMARMADALGLADKCPTNPIMLAEMDLMTPWSGVHGGIAIEGAYGYDKNILRRCDFPTSTYPFICRGSPGNSGTHGSRLGAVSYISLLHDEVNHHWTLFGQCWNAKRPEKPNAEPIATSWHVFSLNQTLPDDARTAILAKLTEIGFNTTRLIEPNYNN